MIRRRIAFFDGIPIRAVDFPHPGTFKRLIGFLYHFREIFVGIFRLPQSVAHGETKIFHLFSGGIAREPETHTFLEYSFIGGDEIQRRLSRSQNVFARIGAVAAV